ncbi:MAG: peptide-methionine (S)-S-oxide reductase MsrA [Fluviicola sp.]
MRMFLVSTLLLIGLTACGQEKTETVKPEKEKKDLNKFSVAYFGSGCFWCVEAIYESVNGVEEVESGYAGGHVENPTYEQVCTGTTGHAETVKVYYDSTVISYEQLVKVFYNSHDPTTANKQGPDRGSQYRSAIFYRYEYERKIALACIDSLLQSKSFPLITTELAPYTAFYKAEAYHQDFECKNPNNGYVRAVSLPRLEQFQLKMPEVIKKEE